jgi:hypothetical protein
MLASRKLGFALPLLVMGLSVAPRAKASSFSFTGTFQQDDNVELFTFGLTASTAVTIETWSYGGGTDAVGQPVSSGGFYAVVSLYSGSGRLVDSNFASGTPPCSHGNADPVSSLCGDAFLTDTLSAGTYLVALTEYPNVPNGLNLSDGFVESGQGNFTGPQFCAVTGAFFDPNCHKRTGNFELDIVGPNAASVVPEPASLFATGLALFGFVSAGLAKRFWRSRAVKTQ